MKLFFATGTCSMACVSAVLELGVPCELIEVSWKSGLNVDALNRLNPLGTTPTLVTESGEVITQNVAILELLADRVSQAGLLEAPGTVDRAKTLSWLTFVAADFHKAFTASFRAEEMVASPEAQSEIEAYVKKSVTEYLDYINHSLEGKKYIRGVRFTIADCYLYVVLGWCEWLEISLENYRFIGFYLEAVSARPSIQKAIALEG